MRSIYLILGMLSAIFATMFAELVQAVPLDNWPTWSVAQPYVSKQVPPNAIIARCKDLDEYCVIEVDKATGEIPVTLSGAGITIDYSGTPGTPVPGSAAFVGGVDPGGDLRGLAVSTGGILDVNVTGSTGTSDVNIVSPIGQTTMAASVPVTMASNQTAIPVDISTTGVVRVNNLPTTVAVGTQAADASTIRTTEGSRTYSDSARYDYTGGSVTTGAWVQVIAATLAAMNFVCITDQSGQIMLLGTGAVASETTVFMIPRGFSGCIPLRIAAATRLSLKAVSATASTGDFVVSGMN